MHLALKLVYHLLIIEASSETNKGGHTKYRLTSLLELYKLNCCLNTDTTLYGTLHP